MRLGKACQILALAVLIGITQYGYAVNNSATAATEPELEQEPMFRPLVERYILDELKQLRTEQAQTKLELMQQIVDREHASVDRGVSYATDTITYFFYLIAAVSSILVIIGWTSIRDIKEKVQTTADEKVAKLVQQYEQRLDTMEKQLHQETQHIESNAEEIAITQQVQSLWLRAAQETSPSQKIAIYDQILKLRHDDCEALTYKADAALEIDEPQWAANLCQQALDIEPEYSHAFYQLACAHTAMKQYDEAFNFLAKTLELDDNYRETIIEEPALAPLRTLEPYKQLINLQT